MTREEAINLVKQVLPCLNIDKKIREAFETLVPELHESEDERIRKAIINVFATHKDYEIFFGVSVKDILAYLEKQKEYVNDLSPEQEAYLMSEKFFKEAEKEKDEFTTRRFLQCLTSFGNFIEGMHYWLEYIGGDMYVGRSDNVLGEKFHITPRQLFTFFSDKLEAVQGPSQEEKQLSPRCKSVPIKSPSDEEIIDALLHHLSEQDGILTAIDGVSTKAIMGYLEKQKEQKPSEQKYEGDNFFKAPCAIDSTGLQCPYKDLALVKDFFGNYNRKCKLSNKACEPEKCKQWNELQAEFKRINEAFENGKKNEVINRPEAFGLQKPAEWSEELNEETITNEFRIIRDKCFNEGIEGWQREKLIARHFYNLGLNARKEK